MKLAVIYDSKTGNTKQAAEWIMEGMNGVANIEAKTFWICYKMEGLPQYDLFKSF